jgi:hypothetical protein
MKTDTFHIQNLRKKKKARYSNYYFALALYNIYKNESKNEARLPVNDFRNHVLQKRSLAPGLKQKLWRYIVAITKAIRNSVFLGKEKPQPSIDRFNSSPKRYSLQ